VSALEAAIATLQRLDSDVPDGEGEVRCEHVGTVAVLTLDAPGTRNALSTQMMVDLATHVQQLSATESTGLLLRSVGPAFCAGGNLNQVRAGLADEDRGLRMSEAMTTVLDTLFDLPLPSIAVVDGPAVGGGLELASACDFRVASPRARFDPAQIRLGVATGWGGAGRLVRSLGRRATLRLFLDGAPVDAVSAQALGLVDALDDDPEALAHRWLATWSRSGVAARALKAQVVDPQRASEIFATVWGGPLHRARMAPRPTR